jgi:hypothetical protein
MPCDSIQFITFIVKKDGANPMGSSEEYETLDKVRHSSIIKNRKLNHTANGQIKKRQGNRDSTSLKSPH